MKKVCVVSGVEFEVTDTDLKFYEKMGVPIPRKCSDCRHTDRMVLRNERQLFDRECGDCGASIRTTFGEDRPEKILCEKCYRNSVE